jgi:predicted nucleic acid-binding protein
LLTSDAVVEELEKGKYPNKDNCLDFIKKIPLLSIEPEIAGIVEVYVKNMLMPANTLGDALHLAVASYHKCDFLVTWSCKNLANANKFQHIKRINTLLGLYIPTLVTPLELLGGK